MGDQASIDKALALTEQEDLAKTVVPLKVTDATLEEIIEQIQRVLPAAKKIEVRGASRVRVSFELEQAQVGQVLHSAATLAGCELHILSGRLLIAPLSELSKEESAGRFPWMAGPNLYSKGPLQRMFVRAVAEDVQRRMAVAAAQPGAEATGVLLGALEPELQQMVRRLAYWGTHGSSIKAAPPIITQDTKVFVSRQPNGFTLQIVPTGLSSSKGLGHDIGFVVINTNAPLPSIQR